MIKVPPSDDRTLSLPVLLSAVAVLVAVLWVVYRYGPWWSKPMSGSVWFIGSSTIARFPLDASFPNASTVNLGLPDQNAVALRERLRAEIAADAEPAGIVLYAGSYDLRAEKGIPPTEIGDRVAAVVADLRSRHPDTPLVLIQVLPARARADPDRAALASLNQRLEALAAGSGAVFVKTHRPPLVDQNGDLLESMSVDNFHLNEAGYRVLAQWLQEDGGAVGQMLR